MEGGRRKIEGIKKSNEQYPLVSIVTVVYNGEQFIGHTIKSVLNQTYLNIEYIIIDGGSTDSTLDIIKKFEPKIDFWISEPDCGISDAFNKGIKLANGVLIGIINADDWYESRTVEFVVEVFKASKTAEFISYGDLYYPEVNFRQVGDRDYRKKINYIMPRLNHPSVFVSKQVYQKYGLYDLKFRVAMDFDFLKRCYKHGVEFKYIDKTLVNMRLVGVSNRRFSGLKEILDISSNPIITLILYFYNSIKWKFEVK